ncbi:MAG: DUF3037 domain-containing protein [Verrucomicrobia bacterium]|nr:DUF3037 domain-containing protein [Verrucomicrobiota bacterium]
MKISYSTITLRYVHDVVTGEFANIGVVLYAPKQRFLKARFTTSHRRLDAMFLKIDHLYFSALTRHIANAFAEMSAQIQNGETVPPVTSLSEMVKQILPPDDSSLQWSEQGGGFSDEPAKKLDELYQRLVERYRAGSERETSSLSASNQTT